MNGTFIPIQLEKENKPQFLFYIQFNSIQFESKIEFDEIMFGFRSNLYFETVSFSVAKATLPSLICLQNPHLILYPLSLILHPSFIFHPSYIFHPSFRDFYAFQLVYFNFEIRLFLSQFCFMFIFCT